MAGKGAPVAGWTLVRRLAPGWASGQRPEEADGRRGGPGSWLDVGRVFCQAGWSGQRPEEANGGRVVVHGRRRWKKRKGRRRGGGGAAGAGGQGTRSAKEGKEGERRKEGSGWVGRSITPCPIAISAGGAQRRGEGGGDGAWVAVHWRPSPP